MTSATIERRTVRETLALSGAGLHGGAPVTVRIHPGEDGIAFRCGSVRTAASPSNVSDTTRCTKLGEIGTVEHLMSAFAGLEITDAEVELTSPELPGLDGSAVPYVEALAATGFESCGAREIHPPFKRALLQDGALSMAASSGAGKWRFEYIVEPRWPGRQVFETEDVVAAYIAEIAPARTFALAEEVPAILANGLAKGLDRDSALILGESDYENAPRFPDEPARHKLLDLIGDLYLAGIPIRLLNVVAIRSGHAANVKLARMLVEAAQPA